MNFISERINEYSKIPQKGIIDDNFVRHIARRISFQEGDKESMINDYLEEVKRNLLQTITHIDKSDTSIWSETSNDDITEESQQIAATNKGHGKTTWQRKDIELKMTPYNFELTQQKIHCFPEPTQQ
ncbi:hypothetical protein H5410_052174 [Solanum commersonii]|uniref:Uncharacterized protein n=1 Tax=Solanum commersonii TaxID=4109 RepID=A0A9J5X0E8_SOLCO|nr:hypothetical protein H5410_052174 [Solanum commersonii]